MSKKVRKKSSDIFNETDYAFGKTTFKKAFPEIKSALVTVEETGNLGAGFYSPPSKVRHYNHTNLGEFIDCSNPLCYNGGFSIGKILRDMMQDKMNHFETVEICQGFEGSASGRRCNRRCLNHFKVKIDLDLA